MNIKKILCLFHKASHRGLNIYNLVHSYMNDPVAYRFKDDFTHNISHVGSTVAYNM